jgi:hypothetical protein
MLAIADLLDSMINIRDYAGEGGRTEISAPPLQRRIVNITPLGRRMAHRALSGK